MRAEYVAIEVYKPVALVFETQEEFRMMCDMMGYDRSIPNAISPANPERVKAFMEKVRMALIAPK